jgi:hypothetical protein
VQVKRRLVIYVQGYDPRGLAEYYRMFRREYRRTCDLYGLTGKIGRADNDPARFITTWDATTRGDNWQVEISRAHFGGRSCTCIARSSRPSSTG